MILSTAPRPPHVPGSDDPDILNEAGRLLSSARMATAGRCGLIHLVILPFRRTLLGLMLRAVIVIDYGRFPISE